MYENKSGVFATIEEACSAALEAQKTLMSGKYTVDDRQRMIENVKKRALERVEEICRSEHTETGYGRYEDKVDKNTGSFMYTPDTKDIPTQTYSGSRGLTVEYYAPFGLIGAVTPVTNPASTIIANGICNLAVGNSVVFNPHPGGVKSAMLTTDLFNKAIMEVGGPENLVTMPAKPNMETLDYIIKHPSIKLLLGTGGPAMVDTLMKSGKKIIAAGPGNPPSIIDSSADLQRAAYNITMSSTFDNNILCVAEKEVFVLDEVYDEFMNEMEKVGNVRLTNAQADQLREMCLIPGEKEYSANKKFVGKNCSVILDAAGIAYTGDPRLAFYEADNMDPFVQTEQMMCVLPIVRCKDFKEACERAVYAEHDNKHSASIWTNNLYHATEFGKMINTTVYVMNGRTFAAFGLGGEGSNSPTIATPTGEGVTGPWSFARKRRFCMANGQGYTI